MKITDIRTYNVFSFRTNFVFVEIYTDEGLSGLGEGTLEYKENALLGAIEDIKRVLIGQDPMGIERITSLLYRDSYWRVGPVLQSAISAVEMALWDIKGKYYNAPVYELLGGLVRDRVRMYANGWFSGAREPEDFAKAALAAKEKGVTALKWDPFGSAYMFMDAQQFSHSIEIVEAVRGAVGSSVDLLIEGHGRFDIATGIKIANALASLTPSYLANVTAGGGKLMAIYGSSKLSQYPDAAYALDFGLDIPAIVGSNQMISLPQGCSDEIVEFWSSALQAMMDDPEFQEAMATGGYCLCNVSGDELTAAVKDYNDQVAAIMSELGLE